MHRLGVRLAQVEILIERRGEAVISEVSEGVTSPPQQLTIPSQMASDLATVAELMDAKLQKIVKQHSEGREGHLSLAAKVEELERQVLGGSSFAQSQMASELAAVTELIDAKLRGISAIQATEQEAGREVHQAMAAKMGELESAVLESQSSLKAHCDAQLDQLSLSISQRAEAADRKVQ